MHVRRTSMLAGAVVAASLTVATVGGSADHEAVAAPARLSSYDRAVLADNPVAYFRLDGRSRIDLTGNRHKVAYVGAPHRTTLPNGERALKLDGVNDFARIADSNAFSIGNGVLSIETWVRVDDLDNERLEDGQFVHWLSKGRSEAHEYAFRLYNNHHSRSNRLSAYVFRPTGGLGEGSYFQDNLRTGQWLHVGVVFNSNKNTVTLYRDGRRRDSDSFAGINPANRGAPLSIGTRERRSFLQGAVAKVAVYRYDASRHFAAHARMMRR